MREGRLVREGRFVSATSAREWLVRGAPRQITGHRLDASPSWWWNRYNLGWVRMRVEQRGAKLVPATCRVEVDSNSFVVLIVPPQAAMTREEADALRQRLRARFEELDPGPGANWTPPPDFRIEARA